MNILRKIKSHYHTRQFALVEATIVLSTPILIRLWLPSLVLFRHLILFLAFAYAAIVGRTFGFHSFEKYGLTRKNLIISAKHIALPTIIWAVIVIFIGFIDIKRLIIPELIINSSLSFWTILVSYAFLSVPIQEILFRGFLINRIKLVTQNLNLIVIYSSLMFGISHLIFENTGTAILTTIISISWAKNFAKYGNLWPIIFSHFIFGFISIYATLYLAP